MAWSKIEREEFTRAVEPIKHLQSDFIVNFAVETNIVLTPVSGGFEISENILDSETVVMNGSTYLFFAQNDSAQNGIYVVVSLSPVVLTRYSRFSTYSQIQGQNGFGSRIQKINTQNFYFGTTSEPFTLGITPIDFTFKVETPIVLERIFLKNFQSSDWVLNGSEYELVIPASEHNKLASTIGAVAVKEKLGNEEIGVEIVQDSVNIDTGDVKLTCGTPFDGLVKFTGNGTDVSTTGQPASFGTLTGFPGDNLALKNELDGKLSNTSAIDGGTF